MAVVVEHAFTILSWHEHLESEDVPPRWMWHVDHELEAWFERVRARYGSKDDDAGDGAGMADNELAEEWLRRRGA